MARQANKGGEIGANGEFYKGGTFIATTNQPKGIAAKRIKTIKKQLIDYYTWELNEDVEAKSIFAFIQGTFGDVRTGWVNEHYLESQNESLVKIESLITRFKDGERWFYPNQEIYS